jgi:S-DNA-T family DNA segregation ATPase FtsK/SpoIIIE
MLVVMDRCDECGFDYGDVAVGEVAGILRSLCARYVEVLEGGREEDLRARPVPDVWSAVEYTCHVRDVLLIQRDRVILALVEHAPSFARMYRDERAALTGYGQEPLKDLSGELGAAANLFAKLFERLSDEQMTRPCIYNFPAAAERDVGWLGRHTVHETKHHLLDVNAVLAQVSA